MGSLFILCAFTPSSITSIVCVLLVHKIVFCQTQEDSWEQPAAGWSRTQGRGFCCLLECHWEGSSAFKAKTEQHICDKTRGNTEIQSASRMLLSSSQVEGKKKKQVSLMIISASPKSKFSHSCFASWSPTNCATTIHLTPSYWFGDEEMQPAFWNGVNA